MLYTLEHVEWALRSVEHVTTLLVEARLPSERLNGRNAGDCLDEVFVQWCFSFNIDDSYLTRGAEIVSLDEEKNDGEEGHGNRKIFAQNAEDDELSDARRAS